MRSVCIALSLALALAARAQAAPAKAPPRSKSAPPLVLAAWKPDHDRIRALLAAGEDPNAPSTIGFTPWMWSLIAQDGAGFELLFDATRDFRPVDSMTANIFLFEVSADDRALVRSFLARGVSPNARVSDGTSALMVAAANGHPEMAALLLGAGADPNAADQQGDTALMSAVRAGSLDTVKALLASKKAAVAQRDRAGRSAMTFAVLSGRDDVQRALREAGAASEPVALPPAPASSQVAVARSLPLLSRASNEWVASGACVACHLQPVMMRVAGVARRSGFGSSEVFDSMERSMRKEVGPDFGRFAHQAVQSDEGVAVASMYVGGDQAYNLAFSLGSAFEAGMRRRPYDRDTAQLLARMQQPDGSWRHGPDRVPMQSGDIASTALAARLLQRSGKVFSARIERARRWLVASVPRNGDDAAFRLLGLRWLNAGAALVSAAASTLAARQLGNGGWAQVDGLNPDAYATGLALVALAEGAGMVGNDPVYRRGVGYLLQTQYPDGSWLVHKRSVPVNRYFESGFPHGKFQFSSFVGTAWATMALMYAEPIKRSQAMKAQLRRARSREVAAMSPRPVQIGTTFGERTGREP